MAHQQPGESMQSDDVQPPSRSSLKLIVKNPFAGYFWGKLLWTAGVWVHSVVAAILAFEATGSALAVGFVTAAQFLPQLVFTPSAGARADGGDLGKQIVTGRIICAAGSFLLA